MFKTRLLSGIKLMIIALTTVIAGGQVLFTALFAISLIGMSELYKVFGIEKKAPGIVGYIFAFGYYALIYMEEYLPVIVFSQISPDMKKETIKVQTVIARSNIQRRIGEGKNLAEILWENRNTGEVWRYFFTEKNQIYQQSARETGGQVLTYEGKVKLTPWHKISAGKTRSGAEAFHDEAYTYLKSADSSGDKKSPDYMKVVEIPAGQFSGELKIKKRDSAGYVTELMVGKTLVEGESFAAGMGLESANFSLQKKTDTYYLRVRGIGHGVGFSQFGGNEMAKNGSNAEEILKKYFPDMELRVENPEN